MNSFDRKLLSSGTAIVAGVVISILLTGCSDPVQQAKVTAAIEADAKTVCILNPLAQSVTKEGTTERVAAVDVGNICSVLYPTETVVPDVLPLPVSIPTK